MHKSRLRAVAAGLLGLAAVSGTGATRYDGDGTLDGRLETERWMINRARYAPEREADRLGLTNALAGGHPDYDVCEDSTGTNNFGYTTNGWVKWVVSRGPLAPNARLGAASFKHSRDMAETGLFQHYSPSSRYYPLDSSPVQRAALEGYTNTVVGFYENIANGWAGRSDHYPDSGRTPESIHDALFIDDTADNRGHRQGILNAVAREIGLGWFRTNYIDGGWYVTEDYDTQDFGRTSSNFFLTDTCFTDANSNGVYNEAEGVSNIEVRLRYGTNEAAWYDASGVSGSFAVPLNALPAGANVAVHLVNRSGRTQRMKIPLGYSTAGTLELTNEADYLLGTFLQPAGPTNFGFRNLVPDTQVGLARAGSNLLLSCTALAGVAYTLQSCDGLATTGWVSFATVTAATMRIEITDTGQGGRGAPATVPVRCYRALLRKD